MDAGHTLAPIIEGREKFSNAGCQDRLSEPRFKPLHAQLPFVVCVL